MIEAEAEMQFQVPIMQLEGTDQKKVQMKARQENLESDSVWKAEKLFEKKQVKEKR